MTDTGSGADVAHWTAHAQDWIAWVRHPNHDAYWAYEAAFERFVGRGTGDAVEIGCGEGRISRTLSGLGYHMTAIDPVPQMLEAARQAESARHYVQAPATEIPLPRGAFDLVVLYNVLMDVDALDAALGEAARLLSKEGRMIVGIVHPFADLVLSPGAEAQASDRYFDTRFLNSEMVDRNGLKMTFRGWMRPISTYTTAFHAAGLTLQSLHEPQPDPLSAWPGRAKWSGLPLFLWFALTKAES